MEEQQRHQYGGQAIIEGVMIRGRDHAAVAVRNPAGEICVRALAVPGWSTGRLRRIPYIRGMIIFGETLVVGMKALSISASLSLENDEDDDTGPIGSYTIAAMLVVAMGLGIGIFFLAPFFVSKLFENAGLNGFLSNLVEGLLRLGAFITYIWLVSRMSDIERVLAYHGAEHKAVHAHEAGHDMTVESLRKFPTAHPRCGTAFLLTVMLMAVIVFIFVPRDPLWLVVGSRILLVPLIAAAAYEFIRYAGRHGDSLTTRILISPSLLLQEMTTREPEDDQIEVAIEAINHAVKIDQGFPVADHNVPASPIWAQSPSASQETGD